MKKDLIVEIATRASSMDYWALGYYLPNPDPILKNLGRDITAYRELLSDPHLSGCVRRRKAAIKGLEWRITPTGNEQVDEELNRLFTALPLNDIITEMLNATLYGYQALEVMWVKVGDKLLPENIVGKPPEWFVFDEDNQLRFKTKANFMQGVLLPERKFLLARQEATYTNPYGTGDLSKCFWAATFKKGGFKFWLEFTEKYGSPWLLGKHPRNTSELEKERLADALANMVGTAIAVVPEDAKVEILEASSKGASSEVFHQFLKFCKAEIAIALLGQNQTTEAEANRASSQAGLEVVEDIRNDDAAIVEATFNQLLKWICELNYKVETLPTFELYEQESIDINQAERDSKLFAMGVRFNETYLTKTYGFGQGDITLQAVKKTENFDPSPAGAFSEHHHSPRPIDQIIDQMGELSQHYFDDRLGAIRAKLDTASSLEEFRDILDEHIAELNFNEYAELFAQGMTTATLLGRYEVKEEAKPKLG